MTSLEKCMQKTTAALKQLWNWLRGVVGKIHLQIVLEVFFVHKPIMVENVFGTESKLGIRLKHVVDQITHGFADAVLEKKNSLISNVIRVKFRVDEPNMARGIRKLPRELHRRAALVDCPATRMAESRIKGCRG